MTSKCDCLSTVMSNEMNFHFYRALQRGKHNEWKVHASQGSEVSSHFTTLSSMNLALAPRSSHCPTSGVFKTPWTWVIIWHMRQGMYDYHIWQKMRLKFRVVKWFAPQNPSSGKNHTNSCYLLISSQALNMTVTCHLKKIISEVGKLQR